MLSFGRLVQVSDKEKGKANFLCTCGNVKLIAFRDVERGKIKSCGCLARELVIKRNKENTTHGRTKTPEYINWSCMKARCYYRKDKDYHNYGGKGITVCKRWLNSFENFLEDMGERPFKSATLDRKDNNKGYCKSNCRWSDQVTQQNNKKSRGGTSDHRGVCKPSNRNKWAASVSFSLKGDLKKRKTIHIGYYSSEIEAAKAYDAKVVELGLEKIINFPEDYIGVDTNILNKI